MLADRIERVVGLVVLAGHGMRPLGVEKLRAGPHAEAPRRRAVGAAETAGKRSHHHAVGTGAHAEIDAVVALRHHGAERALGQLEPLADANRLGALDVVDARDEAPIAADLVLADDLLEAVARLHGVLEEVRIARVEDGREDKLRRDLGERVRRLLRLHRRKRARKERLGERASGLHRIGGGDRETLGEAADRTLLKSGRLRL